MNEAQLRIELNKLDAVCPMDESALLDKLFVVRQLNNLHGDY